MDPDVSRESPDPFHFSSSFVEEVLAQDRPWEL